MKVGWIIQADYLAQEHQSVGWQKAIAALREDNTPVMIIEYKPHSLHDTEWGYESVDIVGLIGSISFVKNFHKQYRGPQLHPFFAPELHYYSRYQHCIDGSALLNTQGFMLPFAEISRQALHGGINTPVFIRPDQALKICEAETADSNDALHRWLSNTKKHSGAQDTTLFWLFPKQSLGKEYRFSVANKSVISGSAYVNKGVLNISSEVSQNIIDFAQYCANEVIDIEEHSYVLDIVELDSGELKIVELNALSTSGYYALNIRKTLQALTNELSIIAESWQ